MNNRPYYDHLKEKGDLVTTYEARRAGFVARALEKNRRATPFVEQARALKIAASRSSSGQALLDIAEIQPALLTAAGVSDKAAGHMLAENKVEAVRGLIEHFLEPAGTAFVEELVFRFLLTKGDALGGAMRNIGGALAQRKLSRAILSQLSLAGIHYDWLSANNSSWIPMGDDDTDIETRLKGLQWVSEGHERTLLYNLKVPLVKSNVDLCLFKGNARELLQALFKVPSAYIALGELKGGIDPAGADEHWKTASAALKRIRDPFAAQGLSPQVFFIGAAIEKRMADEIWEQLEAGLLHNAANLTNADQLVSLAQWLCHL